MVEKIKPEEYEGMPERCPECGLKWFPHEKPRHTKECTQGKMQKEEGWPVEIIGENEEAGMEFPGGIEIEKEIEGIHDYEKFAEGFEKQEAFEEIKEPKKEKRAIKITAKEPKENLFEITDKDVESLLEKITLKPELEKKKSEEAEKSIDIIFKMIQDEISYFKPGEIGDRQKKYLKSQIKNILMEFMLKKLKGLKNLERIQLSEELSRDAVQEIYFITTLGLKERISSKYGYPSDIMKVFQDAADEAYENTRELFIKLKTDSPR